MSRSGSATPKRRPDEPSPWCEAESGEPLRTIEALRDRLLLAFTEPAQGRAPAMVAVEPGAALVTGTGKLPLWILTQYPGDSRAVLEARVRGAGHAVKGAPVAVAVLSPEPAVAQWLAEMADEVAPKVAAVYALDVSGSVRALSGGRHEVLEKALDRAVMADDFPPDQALGDAILVRRRALVKDAVETQVFAKKLGERQPVVTYALTAACVLVFLLQLFWGGGEATAVAGQMGAGSGARLVAGDWWRLFSPAFLHANWMHIGMNMMALYALGPTIESILGRARFLSLYLACAIGASLTTGFINPDISSVGASGAVWGLMGAMLGLAWRPNGVLPAPVVANLRKSMWTPLAINVAISFLPGIDMWGHFGGGAAGFLLLVSGAFTGGLRQQARGKGASRPLVFIALAAVLGVGATASVGTAIVRGAPWRMSEPPELERVSLPGTPLKLLLPAGLTPSEPESSNGVTRYVAGNLSLDPAVVQVTVARSVPTPMPSLLAQLDEEFSPAEPSRVELVDGREVAVVNAKQNGLSLQVAATHADGWEIAVLVLPAPRAPSTWNHLAARIAASIHP